ncbi:uncharacterized protein AMSG_09411 [Thecamonas trahens ATCC 50062]|uniref:Uncharacterized protein n=1 Tax=Thecamonas trahens ATCC 50062 TaxID=461836 RepID=A0A0L0DLD4_THETB|nr:hypothetical protein AMSG_09411 [Thecamonas trahens ATCC 50062]KNC53107.1 hypothetical protein AMSG_09411 [Thecamonas trahens ATCC 50062]|eukprot:XP_013754774.1 hypothetical protein AMSG_09411 [Thecamonas trahens ATCC 50062]
MSRVRNRAHTAVPALHAKAARGSNNNDDGACSSSSSDSSSVSELSSSSSASSSSSSPFDLSTAGPASGAATRSAAASAVGRSGSGVTAVPTSGGASASPAVTVSPPTASVAASSPNAAVAGGNGADGSMVDIPVSIAAVQGGSKANSVCIDCGASNPRWASLSYGTFLCVECSGLHRSLGVQLSFVRSLDLDTWHPSQLLLMHLGGNAAAYAAFAAAGWDTVSSASDVLRAKYESDAAAKYREQLLARVQDAVSRLLTQSNASLFPAWISSDDDDDGDGGGGGGGGQDAGSTPDEAPAAADAFKLVVPLQARAHQVATWSRAEVGQWLDLIGMARYAHAFRAHAIDGSMLAELADHELLREIGVDVVGHRFHVLRAIRLLTGSTPASAAPPPPDPRADAEFLAAATAAAMALASPRKGKGKSKSKSKGKGKSNDHDMKRRPHSGEFVEPGYGEPSQLHLTLTPRGKSTSNAARRASVDVSTLSLNKLMEGMDLPGSPAQARNNNSGVSLATRGRVFTESGASLTGSGGNQPMSGYLFKQASSVSKGWRKRYFVLDAYVLSYYKNKEAADDGDKPSGTIPTMGREVKRVPRKGQYAFVLSHTGTRDYFLRAPDEAAMHKWITALVCEGMCTTEEGGTSDVSSRAPGAVPGHSRSRSPSTASRRSDDGGGGGLTPVVLDANAELAAAGLVASVVQVAEPIAAQAAVVVIRDGALSMMSGSEQRACRVALTAARLEVNYLDDNSSIVVDLAGASVTKGSKAAGKASSRAFVLATRAGSFVFVASSKDECKAWLSELTAALAIINMDTIKQTLGLQEEKSQEEKVNNAASEAGTAVKDLATETGKLVKDKSKEVVDGVRETTAQAADETKNAVQPNDAE